MPLRPGRQNPKAEFDLRQKWLTVLLLAGVFAAGMWLSFRFGGYGGLVYIALWIVSYPVIYAGTCRYCVYYGKKCPIPLEGSCVHYLFARSSQPFGFTRLIWATVAYLLRAVVPIAAMIHQAAFFGGAVYLLLLTAFWFVHLRITGCPHCINTTCPLN
ncbi:MAG: hypothetical protein ACQERN_02350 [Thermodesulfobacteriota bacterium]